MSPSALKDEPNEAYNSTSLPPVNILISHKQTSDRNSRNNSFVNSAKKGQSDVNPILVASLPPMKNTIMPSSSLP